MGCGKKLTGHHSGFNGGVEGLVKKGLNEISDAYDRIEDEAKRSYDDIEGEVARNRGAILFGVTFMINPVLGTVLVGGTLLSGESFRDSTNQMFDVVTGRYADDQKQLAEANDRYNQAVEAHEEKMYQLSLEAVIPEEIFQIAAGNRIERIAQQGQAELDVMLDELTRLQAEFDMKYDFVAKMLGDKFLKYFMWLPLIVGGIISDVRGFLKGDSAAGKRLLNIVVTIVVIIVTFILGFLSFGLTWGVMAVAILGLIGLIITMDTMYGQGLLMNLVFSSLDMVLNDVLQAEDWAGKDFRKLSDEQYYAELTGYVQMGITIAKVIITLGMMSGGTLADQAVSEALASGASEAAAQAAGEAATAAATAAAVDMLGETALNLATTFSAVWGYIGVAQSVNDTYEAKRGSDKLEGMLNNAKTEILLREANLMAAKRKRDMWELSEISYQVDTPANIIGDYIMSGWSNPTSQFDPVMIIAGNYGYSYDGEQFDVFNPMDIFEEANLAGGSSYTRNALSVT